MNAKTYGQVLMGELNAHVEGLRLSIADSNALERCARAVILEFVMRVEERASADLKTRNASMDYPYTQDVCVRNAFLELSTELKESDQACDRCKGSGEVVDIRRGCDVGLMPCPKCKEVK